MGTLDDNGREVLDDTPVAIPVRITRQPTALQELLDYRNIVRQEISRMADEEGHETFEEADDFEVGDDYEPTSPHELEGEAVGADWRGFVEEVNPPPPPPPPPAAVDSSPPAPPGPSNDDQSRS